MYLYSNSVFKTDLVVLTFINLRHTRLLYKYGKHAMHVQFEDYFLSAGKR